MSGGKQKARSPRWLTLAMAIIACTFALAIWIPEMGFAEAWSLPLETISRYHFDYLQLILVLPWHWAGVLLVLGIYLAVRRVK